MDILKLREKLQVLLNRLKSKQMKVVSFLLRLAHLIVRLLLIELQIMELTLAQNHMFLGMKYIQMLLEIILSNFIILILVNMMTSI